MKKAILCGIYLLFFFTSSFTQQLNHSLGDLLVKVENQTILYQIIANNQYFGNVPTRLRLGRRLAPQLNIWLLQFDHTAIHENRFLTHIRHLSAVQAAQFNHLLQMRQTTPNDPQFGQQWHWLNDGSTGGLAGADVDASLAWDITTGGLTPDGDEIVVAVLDDGTDLNHSDLIDNHWINVNEIPDNGQDDDGNGYIDDYDGWNILADNDNVAGGSHGVQVSGMIGAVGNNTIGVSGINWNVKIMMIKNDFLTDEASVLEAYAYPLAMRRLYNQTNGIQGAYVVATNASWGIDFGDPEDAPLWCAFYDTLGTAGILNCGATSNLSINIDVEGDLPTACPSDFMIAVTRTDQADGQGGGFGPIHIDLGAPGIDVFTTTAGGGYGPTTGTSFSSPLVAGLIGLMYSTPCSNLSQLAKADPSAAALLVRQYLLEGVDKIDGFENLVATGGRANAFHSIQLILDNCGPCPPPLAITADNVIDTSAMLNWLPGDSTISVNLRWRLAGSAQWNEQIDVSSPLLLNNLAACSTYEWQLQANCADTIGDYTSSFFFDTDGCCLPPDDLAISNLTDSGADANWTDLLAAHSYHIRIRESSSTSWTTYNVLSDSYSFSSLMECTEYEVQIQTVCDTGSTQFSPGLFFTTFGCGACTDSVYCTSEGTMSGSEWIERVKVHTIDNTSGNDGGYGDYTDQSAELVAGITYPVELSPGFSGSNFLEQFVIWIDYNLDGDFDDLGELAFLPAASQAPLSGTFLIPEWVSDGFTRMRVAMQFSSEPINCQNPDFGEVEDYCVLLSGGSGCPPPQATVNTIDEQTVEIVAEAPSFSFQTLEWRYREAGGTNWSAAQVLSVGVNTFSNIFSSCTDYEIQLRSHCSSTVSSPWSDIIAFTSEGCGACIDKAYCPASGLSSAFEHIALVQLNQINNSSGDDGGYGDFTNSLATTFLSTNTTYPLVLEPGFSFGAFDVVFNLWVDYNQDGDFEDADENIFTSTSGTSTISANITIPANATEGSTRFRISMSETQAVGPCEQFLFGESEDYCVTIVQGMEPCLTPSLQLEDTTMTTASVIWNGSGVSIGYNLRIKAVADTEWTEVTASETSYTFDNLTACTAYELQIRTVCANQTSDYSESLLFHTACPTASGSPQADPLSYQVYPNPFSNSVQIQLKSTAATALQLRLLNLQGQHILERRIHLAAGHDTNLQLPAEQLSAGVYLLQLVTATRQISYKLIKTE